MHVVVPSKNLPQPFVIHCVQICVLLRATPGLQATFGSKAVMGSTLYSFSMFQLWQTKSVQSVTGVNTWTFFFWAAKLVVALQIIAS